MDKHEECCRAPDPGLWYKNKTFIVALVLGFFVGLSFLFPLLEPFRKSFFMYLSFVWWAIPLGLFVGGLIEHFVPQQYVAQILAYPGKRSIIHAVLYGFFMSVCCHGILALAIQLHKKGAPTSSVVAFLLASPWANLPLSIILIGFFGVVKALYIILSAIIIAIITGLIFRFLEARLWVEVNQSRATFDKDYSIKADIRNRYQDYHFTPKQIWKDIRGVFQGAVSLSNMVLWWILIGMGLASLAGAYIPPEMFNRYMGPSVGGMLMTLVVATLMEVCSEGTAPLAFEVYRQTGALGNALVFLMAGVATDYTEIGLLWANVGRRTAIWLPLVTVPQVILFGIMANMIF